MGLGAGAGFGSGQSSRTKWAVVIGTVLVVVLAIVVGLIAGSFRGLHYYEYGFSRDRSSGEVNTNKTYEGGLHLIGPNKDFKTFQADAHFMSLSDLSVGTLSGNEISVTVYIQYIIKKDELVFLHDAYDIGYDDIIQASAREAIKQTTVGFENIQFLRERETVENALLDAVKNRVHSNCCPRHCSSISADEDMFCEPSCKPYETCRAEDRKLHVFVYGLQLGEVDLPSDLRERYLNALLLQAKIETTELQKNETIITKETAVMVSEVNNRAREISRNAEAEAGLVRAQAAADARSIKQQARLSGITKLFTTLNITDINSKAAINYLRNLQQMSDAYFSVNFQYLVRNP